MRFRIVFDCETIDEGLRILNNNKEVVDGSDVKVKPVRKYYCNNPLCGKEVDKSVVAFCLRDKDRYGGEVYCLDCQKKFQ